MNIIKPYFEVIHFDPDTDMRRIDNCGRTCYKSIHNGADLDRCSSYVKGITEKGHFSVLEHSSATFRFICDRGVSHELVRHRLASYSQESTRYANYSKDRFNNEITVIDPCFWTENSIEYSIWKQQMLSAEEAYMKLLYTSSPEKARTVLPNSLKTEVCVTANYRQWKYMTELRTTPFCHPQMREIMTPLKEFLTKALPEIFA